MSDPSRRANDEAKRSWQWLCQACSKISDETWHGIALSAIQRPALYDPAICEKFKRTYESHAFDLIRGQLSDSLILLVARIWDSHFEETTFSLKQIKRQIENPTIARLIWRHRAFDRWNPVNESDAELTQLLSRSRWKSMLSSARESERRRRKLIAAISTLENVEELRSLRATRDRRLAHLASISRRESKAADLGVPIAPLKYGDAEAIFEKTIPIVWELMLLVNATDCAYAASKDMWTKYATQFWSGQPDFSMIEQQKKERRLAELKAERARRSDGG